MPTLTDVDLPATGEALASFGPQTTESASPPEVGGEEDDDAGVSRRGTLLGRYVLLDVIGRGGMGEVYAAYDPELDRRVALKLMRSAAAGESGRARLLREAQAMARVTHPNVITVHDVGTWARGVFVAMELVEGRDLRSWLREEPRPWREVLEIFVKAGRGLAAAHAAGLVHRDFKPANVLLSSGAQVRVVDFGLARLTASLSADPERERSDDDLDDDASLASSDSPDAGPLLSGEVEVTRTGALLGTPAYMSPEQHIRGTIDARADQFGFCVALWEGLYGERPFKGTNRVALMVEVGRGEVPPAPRGSKVPPRLHRVLARGLATDAAHRFSTMDALLAELTRDPGRTRRNAALGVAAIAGIGGLVWSASRAQDGAATTCAGGEAHVAEHWNDERRQALREAFAATQLPYARRSAQWVVARLDELGREWAHAHHEACAATRIRGEQSEALLDLRMLCLQGQRRQTSALVDVLVSADDEAVERSQDAVDALPRPSSCDDPDRLRAAVPPPADAETRRAVAEIEDALAQAHALNRAGRPRQGRPIAEDALQRARTIAHGPTLARALLRFGDMQAATGDKQGAVDTLDEAALVAMEAGDDEMLAEVWSQLAWRVGVDLSRHEDGLAWGTYARAMYGRVGGSPSALSALEHNVGTVLWAAGRYEEARSALERSLAHIGGPDADGPSAARTMVTLSNVFVRQGEHDRALATYQRAKAIALAAFGPDHPLSAMIDNGLGVAHYYLHDLEAAAAAYQRAYDVMLAVLGPDSPELLFSLGNLGNVRREQGDYAGALAAMERVEQLVTAAYPAVHRESGMTQHNIAEVLRLLGRPEEARRRYDKALTIREEVHGPRDRYVAGTLTGLGEALLDLERAADALPHLERALEIREAHETEPRARARTRFALARALAAAPVPRDEARIDTLAREALADMPEVDSAQGQRARAEIQAFVAARGQAPGD